MTEPAQKPGRSRQDYQTPPAFLAAIARQFGPIDLDLACRADNMVAPYGLTEELDSLAQDWADPTFYGDRDRGFDSGADIRVAFCNPPFADIRPWAAKLELCRWLPRWTLMLVPASMSSGWWVGHVLGKAMAYGIPRLQFVGADAVYPKDLALLAAGFGVAGTGYWDWRKLVARPEAVAAQ